jgi:hypothetical protein
MTRMNKLPQKKTQTISRLTPANSRKSGQASDTTSVTGSTISSTHIFNL